MKTESLQGNLLSFFVGLALGKDKEPDGRFYAPWDWWEGDIHYCGNTFLAFDSKGQLDARALEHLYPHVKLLRLSTIPMGDDRWQVALPEQQCFNVKDPLLGYALAIVWSVFGADVPDHYECPHFEKTIILPPFNVPYGMRITPPPANAKTASTCTFGSDPGITYRDALNEARRMEAAEECDGYSCDGHSWVLAKFHDGTSKYLYDGDSTIGLPTPK